MSFPFIARDGQDRCEVFVTAATAGGRSIIRLKHFGSGVLQKYTNNRRAVQSIRVGPMGPAFRSRS
jgi:hypothetical protein